VLPPGPHLIWAETACYVRSSVVNATSLRHLPVGHACCTSLRAVRTTLLAQLGAPPTSNWCKFVTNGIMQLFFSDSRHLL
jgi:hypothetical protein